VVSKRFLKHIAFVSALSVLLFGTAFASALAESQNSPRLDPRICEWREEATIAERCNADRFPVIIGGKDAGPGTGPQAQDGTASGSAGPSGAGTGGAASGDSGGTAASGGGQITGGKKGDNGRGNGGGDGSPNGQTDANR